ncbi:hypothetical protein CSUI_006528 [Cystoisospora suis]|uniref:Uncharacterized protein n=1 Tax=Cystoisospora suis TaxID=483139 RepID=A0A2C6KU33_9APIC|nr:hypothetical protein CSUI_006528 [Cystoisospora suis]
MQLYFFFLSEIDLFFPIILSPLYQHRNLSSSSSSPLSTTTYPSKTLGSRHCSPLHMSPPSPTGLHFSPSSSCSLPDADKNASSSPSTFSSSSLATSTITSSSSFSFPTFPKKTSSGVLSQVLHDRSLPGSSQMFACVREEIERGKENEKEEEEVDDLSTSIGQPPMKDSSRDSSSFLLSMDQDQQGEDEEELLNFSSVVSERPRFVHPHVFLELYVADRTACKPTAPPAGNGYCQASPFRKSSNGEQAIDRSSTPTTVRLVPMLDTELYQQLGNCLEPPGSEQKACRFLREVLEKRLGLTPGTIFEEEKKL